MSEVKRYRFNGEAGEFVDAALFDAMQRELAGLRDMHTIATAKLEKIRDRSTYLDPSRDAFIPNALDAWGRAVPQYLHYKNGFNASIAYCNGWNDSGGYWSAHAGDLKTKLTAAEQELAPLKAFASEMVEAAGQGGSFDGWEIQDIAVKHGLLRVEPREEACGEVCACSECGFPTDCYRKTDLVKPIEPGISEVVKRALSFENQRIQPARFKCLACGEYHEGSGNLPCPKMSPMSVIPS
ncbi:hypothetical protein [Pseudomonas serbica]|uniref:hypothetical protein n=1 Tax=Pseudomonas serbica TaxID=2965074 RepID=UPI00237BBF04|nr:hypothetical protein [Pseudomonas serbica]